MSSELPAADAQAPAPQPGRIIAREACIGIVIGGVLSAAIAYFAFRGTPWLSMQAFHSDLPPQTLGICIFTALGVTLGSRPKARKGLWPALEQFSLLPKNLLLRVIVLTLAGLAVGAAPMALCFMALAPDGASFGSALVVKTIYGAILSGIVAALSVRAVMGEFGSRVPEQVPSRSS